MRCQKSLRRAIKFVIKFILEIPNEVPNFPPQFFGLYLFPRGWDYCSSHFQQISRIIITLILVGFVALRPKSTAMVIAGRSVHLTTLFPGQA